MGPNKILVVDDETGIRELLSEILYDEGYQVVLAENAEQARAERQRGRPDLVLLDIWMPDTDGISLLKEWAGAGLLTMPVVMMSGHGTIDTAVEATRIGATDFLEKPITLQKLLTTVSRALKRGEAMAQPAISLAGLGKSPLAAELKRRLAQLANLKTPLLLLGEKGAGAELCARFLHQSHTPWVSLENMTVLGENPFELLEQARDGILYLDEVGELGKLEQKGLLLLLAKLEKFNVRLICASSQPLSKLTQDGAFNTELYQALSTVALSVPSLREHREDIPEIAAAILAQMLEEKETPTRQLTTAALNVLRNYNWPGNLPQLHNVVHTLALTSLDEQISADDAKRVLAQHDQTSAGNSPLPLDLPLRDARDEFERVYFEHHIRLEGGNMSRVAEKVGLERTHLYRKLKQLGIRFARKTDS
jgi:two-component system nitrogen regulation response regulator NtrX